MVLDRLNELVAVSNELAALRGVALAEQQPWRSSVKLHPDLMSVLRSGALALELQGIDATRLLSFTESARGRGLRRNVFVFGWHPKGHSWFAAPDHATADPVVLQINRLDGLSVQEISLDDFVARCVADAREAVEQANEPEAEAAAQLAKVAPKVEFKSKGPRPAVRVVLADSDGASVLADGQPHEFSGPELGYVAWCMRALQMMSEADAPDLSRWQPRCQRACRVEAMPAEGDAGRAAWDARWLRLTRKDRSAPGPVSHQVLSWKLLAPGHWELAPNELSVLRRAKQAIPPRHKPSVEQQAIWARWIAIIQSDLVELKVR